MTASRGAGGNGGASPAGPPAAPTAAPPPPRPDVLAQVARLQDEINSGGAHLDRMAQPELLEIARVRAEQVDLLKRHVKRGASSRERLRGVIDDLKAQLAVARAAAAAAAAAVPDDESRELLESYVAVEEARLFLFLFSRLFLFLFLLFDTFFSQSAAPPP